MFYYKQLGEVEDDIFYTKELLKEDLMYAQAMLDQPISDYEKERWQAEVSQFSGMLADIGVPELNYSQLFGGDEFGLLEAGFDLSSNWPILAILGVGSLMMFKKEPKRGKSVYGRRKRKKR